MVAGFDNLLEEDVYNGEMGHAAKHNAVNDQVNFLTEQLAAAFGRIIYPENFGAVGDGIVDDTTALQDALDEAATAGGGVVELAPDKTYKVTATLTARTKVTLRGADRRSSIIRFVGTGRLFDLTGVIFTTWQDFKVEVTTSVATAFYLDGTFRGSWRNVTVDGTNNVGTLAAYTQRGFELRGNSGDSRIVDCDLNNLGTAIATDSIQNYLLGSVVGNCRRGVHGDAGSYGAGLSIDSCTFVGKAEFTEHHILIDVNANSWWVSNTWFEGALTTIQVGKTGVGGPTGFGMVNCMCAGTNKILDIQNARQTYLSNIRMTADVSSSPDDLSIGAEAAEGVAANLVSNITYEFGASDFPAGWTYLGRNSMRIPGAVNGNLALYGKAAITPSANSDIALDVNGLSGATDDLVRVRKGVNNAFRVNSAGKVLAAYGLGLGNVVGGSTLGTVIRKFEIFDQNGVSLGYVPIYNTIT